MNSLEAIGANFGDMVFELERGHLLEINLDVGRPGKESDRW
jgi:hypothetical protein